jgi:nitrogen fixation NifU-like protein
MDENLKREIILDNYSNPANKLIINDNNYIKVNTNNSSCIDNLDIWILIEDDIIKDIKFDGEACAISTASTSIMTKELINKTIDEAKIFINDFYNMIEEKEYNEELLEQANAYNDISKQPNRKKCALLGWWGIDKALKK